MRTTDYRSFLSLLRTGGVRFIIVGGVAGNIRGAARATFDLDLVYARDREDIRRLVDALKPHSPYLRGAPPGLPFTFDEWTVRNGLNFTLTTSLGDLDLLGEVAGGGTYEQLLPFTSEVHAFGVTCPCVTLERLIQLKRAAGRPKDFEAIAELQAILEERKNTGMS